MLHGQDARRRSVSEAVSSRLAAQSSGWSCQRGQRSRSGQSLPSGRPRGRHGGLRPDRNARSAGQSSKTSSSLTLAMTALAALLADAGNVSGGCRGSGRAPLAGQQVWQPCCHLPVHERVAGRITRRHPADRCSGSPGGMDPHTLGLQQSAPDAVLAARCPLPHRHFEAAEAHRALVAQGDRLGRLDASALPPGDRIPGIRIHPRAAAPCQRACQQVCQLAIGEYCRVTMQAADGVGQTGWRSGTAVGGLTGGPAGSVHGHITLAGIGFCT